MNSCDMLLRFWQIWQVDSMDRRIFIASFVLKVEKELVRAGGSVVPICLVSP